MERTVATGVDESVAHSAVIHPLRALRILGSASGPMLAQASLHSELARVEWAEEKSRLLRLAVAAALGSAFLLCVMLFAGVLVIAVSWDSVYRVAAIVAVIVVYAISAGIALHKLLQLSAQGEQAFAATREEISADLEMLKSRL